VGGMILKPTKGGGCGRDCTKNQQRAAGVGGMILKSTKGGGCGRDDTKTNKGRRV
jgi:hypothetical protein